MFHGFDYPDETGIDELHSRFWHPVMKNSIIEFPRPEQCDVRRFVRSMGSKVFNMDENLLAVARQEEQL